MDAHRQRLMHLKLLRLINLDNANLELTHESCKQYLTRSDICLTDCEMLPAYRLEFKPFLRVRFAQPLSRVTHALKRG